MVTESNLASIAAMMRNHRVVEFESAGVRVRLHESAFSPVVQAGQPEDVANPARFLDSPTDDQLRYWSVEGEPVKPEDVDGE
jgi:hypothetical protein